MSSEGPLIPPTTSPSTEELRSLPWLSRLLWFTLGTVAGALATFTIGVRPWTWSRSLPNAAAVPYEGLPFADNAGVCQEYVALANRSFTAEEARAFQVRLTARLPSTLRAENVRVVRALEPGDRWTVAVDAQSGAGDEPGATQTSGSVNTSLGNDPVRFVPVFYSTRRLYDTAHVLCMPRDTVNRR